MGLEPTTSTLQRSHSSQLSYAPVGVRRCRSGLHTVPADRVPTTSFGRHPIHGHVSDQGLRRPGPLPSHAHRTVTPTHVAGPNGMARASSLRPEPPAAGARRRRSAPGPSGVLMGTTDRDELLDTLTEGIEALTTSDAWRAHLEVQGRFHHYSFSNALLISAQDPGASRVAGFATWKRLGRSVRKGENAIWILAPMTGKRTRNADGEERRPIVGFRPVPVFDVAQTDGDPLPEVCRALQGDDPTSCFDLLAARARNMGYSVVPAELPGGTNGDCAFALRRIRVECRNDPAQQVKTLAHELAHALLHEGTDDRPLAELEAESTAYVVCRSLGLDTADYTFGYVACWAGGGPEAVARIKASGGRIQRAASVILDGLEAEGGVAPGV